jgi:segregation and condensation protein B
MTDSELKNIIEAALLVAGQPLSIDKMLSLFPEGSRPPRDELQAVLHSLQQDYADRGIELKQIDRSYRFQTREKYSEWIVRLSEERPLRYSRALLETLAIIAYRQPVTRGEIEDIRGVTVSSEIIKTLLGREWIRQVGQREVPGRPALYGTTRGFLEHFNLAGLDELPPLAELRDIDKIAAELNLQSRMEPEGAQDEPETDDVSSEEIKPPSEKPVADGANGAADLQSSDTANSLR